jgi:hypothetical protein
MGGFYSRPNPESRRQPFGWVAEIPKIKQEGKATKHLNR